MVGGDGLSISKGCGSVGMSRVGDLPVVRWICGDVPGRDLFIVCWLSGDVPGWGSSHGVHWSVGIFLVADIPIVHTGAWGYSGRRCSHSTTCPSEPGVSLSISAPKMQMQDDKNELRKKEKIERLMSATGVLLLY